jgi:hypothetical protein
MRSGLQPVTLDIENFSKMVKFLGPVHLAYNPFYSAYFFFQPEQYFSLIKNQPTVFFSRLIIPAKRLLNHEVPRWFIVKLLQLP